jgi:tRNA modification GTPase
VETDTIFALSSGALPSAIAVIRLSGPQTRFVFETMTGSIPSARHATRVRLVEPASNEMLDDALALFFAGPASFTGEDVGELHVHGSRSVIKDVLAALASVPGCRPAQQGEFTRRAFLNGKLDLTGVEAIADLIAAETSGQRRQALHQLEGGLADAALMWRSALIQAMMLIEADLDFSDEGDVRPLGYDKRLVGLISTVLESVQTQIAQGQRGERIRDGVTVVILGAPNAGKSTLMNALARRDVAIVSAIPGTTRDPIEVRLDLDGVPVTLVDTAGLREARDDIESEGIRRALDRAHNADIVLWVREVDAEDSRPDVAGEVIHVVSKIDSAPSQVIPYDAIGISAVTGLGLDRLLNCLSIAAMERISGEPALVTRERHRVALLRAAERLQSALDGIADGRYAELVSEDLRLALRQLEALLGRVNAEDILDSLFREFCIGK